MIAWPLIDIDGAKRGQPLSIIAIDEGVLILQDGDGDVLEARDCDLVYADTKIAPSSKFARTIKEAPKSGELWVAIREMLPNAFAIAEDLSYAVNTYTGVVAVIHVKDKGYRWEITIEP